MDEPFRMLKDVQESHPGLPPRLPHPTTLVFVATPTALAAHHTALGTRGLLLPKGALKGEVGD